MNCEEAARLAGALDRVVAAGLTVTRVEIEMPDGPTTVPLVGTWPMRPRGTLARLVVDARGAARVRQ